MNDKPLLSICIPTRNRAAFLYRTLRSITESPVFQNGNEVEIVISDNASTDATEEIVRIFKEKYGDKIVYSRNGENICDKNFEQVLRLGNGEFLKLNNDTFWFDENGLEKLLSKIKKYQADKPVLFFTNDGAFGDVLCKNLDDFVAAVSYMVTWLGGFGIWKADFDRITDFSANAERHLTQTETVLKEVVRKNVAVVIREIYLNYQFVWNKRRNSARIFGEYYLDILNTYVQKGVLSKSAFNKEKRTIIKEYIFSTFYSLKFERQKFNLFDDLKKYYRFDFYFYFIFAFAFVGYIFDQLAEWWKIKRRGVDGNFRKHWKNRNKSSLITPVKVDSPNSVYVGKGSSGELIVENCDPEKDTLIIGEQVEIGKGVRFVFNGTGKLIVVKSGIKIPDGSTVYPDAETGGTI